MLMPHTLPKKGFSCCLTEGLIGRGCVGHAPDFSSRKKTFKMPFCLYYYQRHRFPFSLSIEVIAVSNFLRV
jgi:hypothetical protein